MENSDCHAQESALRDAAIGLRTLSAGCTKESNAMQAEITAEGKKLLGSLSVQPGMPVDMIIKSGKRDFVSYSMKPITDQFARTLKEP